MLNDNQDYLFTLDLLIKARSIAIMFSILSLLVIGFKWVQKYINFSFCYHAFFSSLVVYALLQVVYLIIKKNPDILCQIFKRKD